METIVINECVYACWRRVHEYISTVVVNATSAKLILYVADKCMATNLEELSIRFCQNTNIYNGMIRAGVYVVRITYCIVGAQKKNTTNR